MDGFACAVPTTRKEAFIRRAGHAESTLMEWGASRMLECWEGERESAGAARSMTTDALFFECPFSVDR
ncbi:DUF1428 family protein [Parahaliea maris]|uniref:DUF1428 family protein n=1 Tax=Parahaliea maris TaxID=2716870 RepID=UPI0038B3B0DD